MVQLRTLVYLLAFAPGALSAAMQCTNCDNEPEPEPPTPPAPPAPPAPPVPHPSSWTECTQEWFGAAPFCGGECPPGSRFIRSSSIADRCQASTPSKIIHCYGLSSHECIFGTKKVLCEMECVGVVQQA